MRKYSALLGFFSLFLLSGLTVQAQQGDITCYDAAQVNNFACGQAARVVLGQTNFTAGNPNSSQSILGGVSGLALYNGILYVADSNRVAATPNNSRIMAFPTSQIPGLRDDLAGAGLTDTDCYICGFYNASFSLGQTSFTFPSGTTAFSTNRSQSGLANATGVATDGHYFAVADTDNNRVLLWNEVPTQMNQPADVVIGQTGFTTFKTPQLVDQYSLRGPQGVWIQNGKLFVADTQNNRVLIWNTMPTQNNQGASVVLGQNDFNHNNQPPPNAGNPTTAANQLLNPTSVTSDGTRLYISDLGYNRVLIWNSIPTVNAANADVVVGQPDMTQTAANNANVCAGYNIGPFAECRTSLNYPRYALASGNKLFIADGGNDRVLVWNNIPTSNAAPPDIVLGEPDFVQDVVSSASISIASTAIDNTGAVDLLPTPQALAYDPATQNLYVSDPYNRRVLIYTPGDYNLPPQSVVNWASEIIRQEGIVTITGTPTSGDTVSITIANGTAYKYTVKSKDSLDNIAQGLVDLINAGSGDANVTAIFDGTGTGTVYLSSKGTSLGYDTISLSAASSNSAAEVVTTSGAYLSSGTAATGAMGMLVEINDPNGRLSDQTLSATLDGTSNLPNVLGGVRVYMDGYITPLLKVSPNQIVTQIPYGYGDRNSTSVYVRTVHSDGSVTATSAMPVYIAQANPGIFNAPSVAGQPRPWPISMAFHQSGNPTAVVSIDGSVSAGNTATITINGVAYTYTVVSADTLLTITQNLIKLINATDQNVTASLGGAFTRVVLTAKQPGAAGTGITVAGSTSTNAAVTVTAYSSATCCNVTPGSLITPSNPAGQGELITISGAGLGPINDMNGNEVVTLGTGVPYGGVQPNTAVAFVTATLGGTTAQTIFADLPPQSYGIYNMQIVIPSNAASNSATPLYVAQNAFISNTVTLPVGTPGVSTTPVSTAPATTVSEIIDFPSDGSTVSGTMTATGWAVNTAVSLSGVNVAVDGNSLGTNIPLNIARPDVCAIFSSANCPTVGWAIPFDTTQFPDGQHTITLTALSTTGPDYTITRHFSISNAGTSNSQTAIIDSPVANFDYRGVVNFGGWAVNTASAVTRVKLYLDGALQASVPENFSRPDVCAIFPSAPNCTASGSLAGWISQVDTTKLADGNHTLTALGVSANGQNYSVSHAFTVANFSTSSTTHNAIDSPSASAGVFNGTMAVAGWAVDDNAPITSVSVSVDGVSYGNAAYGAARPDVCAIFKDAGCPNVGFSSSLDTTLLSDGQHMLTVIVTPAGGQSITFNRPFSVGNQGTVLGIIDSPNPSSSVSGVFTTAGWALSSATDNVTGVSLLVDGRPFGNASYGTNRPDVCVALPGRGGCPNVGWTASLSSAQLTNGNHVLEATISTAAGKRASTSSTFAVSNAATGPGHIGFAVPGSNSSPFIGLTVFSGYALNDNTTVNSLSISIDGVPYGTTTDTVASTEACTTYPSRANCPNAGWTFGLDTTQLTDGNHTFGITENNADGTFYTASTPFTVANYSTGNPTQITVDIPSNTTAVPVFGTINLAGWAINSNSAITAVSIAVDGIPVGAASYGGARADVCIVYPGRAGCPNVGWNFQYNTSLLPNGIHSLDVTAITVSGQSSTISQQFSIAN